MTDDLKYDWVVSQENRLASEECCLSEAEIEQDDLGIALERNTGLLDELPDARKGMGERVFSGSQDVLGADRASEPGRMGVKDPLDNLLERTWRLLNPPVFHAHYCSKCFHLRVCYQKPCKYRATDLEREWECGCQP